MNEKKYDFLKIINGIQKDKVLLPDFQRKFVWKEIDKQKGLIASVLAKIPVGSILLLEANASEFASKRIGKSEYVDSIEGGVDYLLDGQQRITVLANAFSNVIFNSITSSESLTDSSLQQRYFLKFSKWKYENKDEKAKNLFGEWSLKFEPNKPSDDPDFLNKDIKDRICAIDMVSDKTFKGVFHFGETVITTVLDDYCNSFGQNEYMLIPLFLLIEEDETKTVYGSTLKRIISKYAEQVKDDIVIYYEEKCDDINRLDFVKKIIASESMQPNGYTYEEICNDSVKFNETISVQRENWIDKMRNYLGGCIADMNMNVIWVQKSKRNRAIDIYENLNMGGVALNTFDLIMAKVAQVVNVENGQNILGFYDRMYNYVGSLSKGNNSYDKTLLLEDSKCSFSEVPDDYNATIEMKCLDDYQVVSAKYTDCFLNVMALCFFLEGKNMDMVNPDVIKRSNILEINSVFINKNAEKVWGAMDRACFFLQGRCGLRGIGELQYKHIFTIISLLFMDDSIYSDAKNHNLLEGWYWSVLFSGEFDRDQNSTMVRNLRNLYDTIKNDNDLKWLIEIRKKVMAEPEFSDKDFLLFKNAQNSKKYPKKSLSKYVCQYMYSQTYPDLIDNSIRIQPFMKNSESLEMHHIIPLDSQCDIKKSSKTLRYDNGNVLNSPINYIYITKDSNKKIGGKSIEEYSRILNDSVLYTALFPIASSDVLEMLSKRFDGLKGNIETHIDKCIRYYAVNKWTI